MNDDFYAKHDAKYDAWLDSQGQRDMGNSLPYELTALEPEHRRVKWKEIKHDTRELLRPVHPEVADEAERLDAIHRPSKEEVSKPFSPSPLMAWRAGWAFGKLEALDEQNKAWVGMEHSVLRKAVLREGADHARKLLDQVIATLEETSCKSVRESGRCLRPVGHTELPHGNGKETWPVEEQS